MVLRVSRGASPFPRSCSQHSRRVLRVPAGGGVEAPLVPEMADLCLCCSVLDQPACKSINFIDCVKKPALISLLSSLSNVDVIDFCSSDIYSPCLPRGSSALVRSLAAGLSLGRVHRSKPSSAAAWLPQIRTRCVFTQLEPLPALPFLLLFTVI